MMKEAITKGTINDRKASIRRLKVEKNIFLIKALVGN